MLTKSNFKKFLYCSCQLWLVKQRPELLPAVEAGFRKAFDDGNEVDAFARKLFPDGFELHDRNDVGSRSTAAAMAAGKTVLLQPTFTGDGITCRCDVLVKNGDKWDLYEVKSSTEVKEEHIFDVTFQGICLSQAGVALGKTFIVYVNNKFVKNGTIDPKEFFVIEDVTRRAAAAVPLAVKEIARAKEALTWSEEAGLVHLNTCSSPEKCKFLPLCIGTMPHKTIYDIAADLPKDRLRAFVERGLIAPNQVPADVLGSLGKLSLPEKTEEPVVEIDKQGIARELGGLVYPLYFLDYETFFPAVPVVDGYKPFQQMVFQYSVHVMEKQGGKLAQFEYIHETFEDPGTALTESLLKHVGPEGSVIVWNERFEATRNEELGRSQPEHALALRSINERMFDLMLIVKKGLYVDSRFDGSASLKKVLPVMAPELSYKDLAIQEGETASMSWAILTSPRTSLATKEKLKRDMLAYCERDTLAMVVVYQQFLAATK